MPTKFHTSDGWFTEGTTVGVCRVGAVPLVGEVDRPPTTPSPSWRRRRILIFLGNSQQQHLTQVRCAEREVSIDTYSCGYLTSDINQFYIPKFYSLSELIASPTPEKTTKPVWTRDTKTAFTLQAITPTHTWSSPPWVTSSPTPDLSSSLPQVLRVSLTTSRLNVHSPTPP